MLFSYCISTMYTSNSNNSAFSKPNCSFLLDSCQSVSCEVIEFDVTVVQWYRQCMPIMMGDSLER